MGVVVKELVIGVVRVVPREGLDTEMINEDDLVN